MSDYYLFSAPTQNLGGYKFKEHRQVETVVMQWLITGEMDLSQQGIKRFVPRCVCGEVVGWQ